MREELEESLKFGRPRGPDYLICNENPDLDFWAGGSENVL